MSSPELDALLTSIQYANAAYVMDEMEARRAVADLGATLLDRMSTDDNQAITIRDGAGYLHLVPCGSRVTEGTMSMHMRDLLTDWNCDPYDIGTGRFVACDPFKRAMQTCSWFVDLHGSEPVTIHGHSLGGWEATYMLDGLPGERIVAVYAWESPLQGNDAYWRALRDRGVMPKLNQQYHGQDPWALWPWEQSVLNKGPSPVNWIRDGKISQVTADQLPTAGVINAFHLADTSDHDTDRIIASVKALRE